MKYTFVATVLFSALTCLSAAGAEAPADCLTRAQDKGEAAACRNQLRDAVEQRLSALNARILWLLDEAIHNPRRAYPPENRDRVVEAQRAWVRYRDAQCEETVALLGDRSETSQSMEDCRMTMAVERIKQLEALEIFLNGRQKLCLSNVDTCKAN